MNMTSEQAEFHSWKIVPARLNAMQAAWFLGFELHEIPILIAANLLRPLGHPARNGMKFFATQATASTDSLTDTAGAILGRMRRQLDDAAVRDLSLVALQ